MTETRFVRCRTGVGDHEYEIYQNAIYFCHTHTHTTLEHEHTHSETQTDKYAQVNLESRRKITSGVHRYTLSLSHPSKYGDNIWCVSVCAYFSVDLYLKSKCNINVSLLLFLFCYWCCRCHCRRCWLLKLLYCCCCYCFIRRRTLPHGQTFRIRSFSYVRFRLISSHLLLSLYLP